MVALPASAQQQQPSTVTPPGATATDVQAAPQLSPKAAYDDAMHPLDLTRHSIANWSGAEVAALTVSIGRARNACQARDPHTFTGADLIDYARLCGLGQEWGTVVLASTLYIDANTLPKPLLTEAHAARVDADLRLHSEPDALRDTRAMFAAVPYSPLIAEASDEAIEYMRFSSPEDALALANEREPLILAQLKLLYAPAAPATPNVAVTPATPKPSSPATADGVTNSAATQSTSTPHATAHELYAQGLTLAALQQLANKAALARDTVAQLDSALPMALVSDEALAIAEDRRRYALLGKPLPGLMLNRSLGQPAVPEIPAVNTMTVLLLFPDWCAQCIVAMGQVPETVFRISGHEAYYYGLLAETVPERKPDATIASQQISASFNPAFASALLADKPVVTVPPSTLTQFSAEDFPFLVVTDRQGIVRVAQPVDADDVSSGGKVDSAVAVVGQRWPGVPLPPQAPAAVGLTGSTGRQ